MAATLNWYKMPYTYIGREQYNAILESLRADKGMLEIPKTDFRRPCFFDNTFQVIPLTHSSAEIRVTRDLGDGMESTRYKFMNSNETVDEQNDTMSGGAAYDILDGMFYREHGISIFRAYTAQKYKDLFRDLKACVPPQPHFAKPCGILDHGYKADVSSCFPAELSKPLPTLNGCKVVAGMKKPTKDFPFAFYLQSHHIAIYKEFSTRELRSKWYADYYPDMYDDLILPASETTVLCPACKYSFAGVMRELYDGRNRHAENKGVMNKTIGVFHYNNNPRLAHVAAIVLARCIYHMIIRANMLTAEGNEVFHIATDSILWRGKMSRVACDPEEAPKDLGKFMLEEREIRFCIRSTNCYQFEQEDGTVVTRFSGNIPKDVKNKMQLGDVMNYEEQTVRLKRYYKNDEDLFVEAED